VTKRNIATLAKVGDCVVVRCVDGLSEKIIHLVEEAEGVLRASLGSTRCHQVFFTQDLDANDGEDSVVEGPFNCLWCAIGTYGYHV
jgi:hypothetical protein